MVGLVSFLLISTVIRPHLKILSHRMQEISQGLENKTFDAHAAKCDEHLCQMDVLSDDEIGVSAQAYNQMLSSLIQAHEVERVYTQFSKVMSENLDVEVLADETVNLLIQSTNIDAGAILISKKGQLELAAASGILDAKSLLEHDVI
jgi:hypothetical protein